MFDTPGFIFGMLGSTRDDC